MYRTVRVGPKGLEFLNSFRPDYQPALYLSVTPDMVGNDADGEAGLVNGLSQHELYGMSQAEYQLFKMLVQERLKLARESRTAPYALCGDQTLRNITLRRPPTRARLANIDGVNQHFLEQYGDNFIQTIRLLSQELGLSLGGEPITKSPLSRYIKAWKMWQEEGLTVQQIANHSSRTVPIKESTVSLYILSAVRGGLPIDWDRFCLEHGLVQASTYNEIQNVVARVGKESLNPIKAELPEEVTYAQISACLLMHEMGISILPSGRTTQHSSVNPCLETHRFDKNNSRKLLMPNLMDLEKSPELIS